MNYITEEILQKAGFEEISTPEEKEVFKKEFYIPDYTSWRKWTNDVDDKTHCLKIDISRGPTNNGAYWNVHLDNCDCCTVGCADISYIEKFNLLMEVFDSKFRL